MIFPTPCGPVSFFSPGPWKYRRSHPNTFEYLMRQQTVGKYETRVTKHLAVIHVICSWVHSTFSSLVWIVPNSVYCPVHSTAQDGLHQGLTNVFSMTHPVHRSCHPPLPPPSNPVVVYVPISANMDPEITGRCLSIQKYFRPGLVHPPSQLPPDKLHLTRHKHPDISQITKFIHFILWEKLCNAQSSSLK